MDRVLFHELQVGDNIWFKNPYASFSHWGTVESLDFNFEGNIIRKCKSGRRNGSESL